MRGPASIPPMSVISLPAWATVPAGRRVMVGSDPTLERLMERYADGDVAAFDALYAALERPVRSALGRWIRQDDRIDDALQQTLLKVHASRQRYVRGAPVLPWVLTIARNVAIDSLRSAAVRRERSLDEEKAAQIADDREPTWSEADAESVVAAVREAVAELPASARDVVRMHKLEGRTMAAIAEVLGIKEGAVRVRAHRGYRALAERLLGPRGVASTGRSRKGRG